MGRRTQSTLGIVGIQIGEGIRKKNEEERVSRSREKRDSNLVISQVRTMTLADKESITHHNT